MNTDALVELIARRVLEELLARSGSLTTETVKKETVLVVGDCADRDAFAKTLGQGFCLSFAADMDQPEAAGFDHIILASLPNSLLSALTIGLERGSEGCVLVESLLLGKTVHILEEGIAYRRFRETAKPAFYKVFQDKEAQLLSFGMQVTGLDSLAAALRGQVVSEVPAPQRATVNEVTYQVAPPAEVSMADASVIGQACELTQRVVGERDLRRCLEQGFTCITLGPDSLLTPLARDYIRMTSELDVVTS
ncbi:hypothetical protein [Kistimonas asteriae]|uniref:hypothetical protein n=1 Tax=Kistimonas asteriae TaxID=517724 RepID=UPI001BABF577|nr:hypothetical protein [Kistimonas asteriae]